MRFWECISEMATAAFDTTYDAQTYLFKAYDQCRLLIGNHRVSGKGFKLTEQMCSA